MPLEPDKEYYSVPKSPLLTETSDSEASIFEPDPESLTADESDVSEHVPDRQPMLFQCKTEPKFIVFWSCLASLFSICRTCCSSTVIEYVATRGCLLSVEIKCKLGHVYKWFSQPRNQGNLQFAAAILYSGNTYSRVSEMFSLVNISFFSHSVFYNLQKSILFPVLNTVYKRNRFNILEQCKVIPEGNDFTEDGRCDSPGYSAKYGTYSLMSTQLNKVVDFFVVHVGTVENSSRMEKEGLKLLLERYAHLKISTLTTDRHIQVRAYLKKEHPQILHQFDVWHFGKSIKKKLTAAAKKKANVELIPWIKSIINHLWWCSATCNGNSNILREKWKSILFHITDRHEWQGNQHYHRCQHGELQKKRKYLRKDTPVYFILSAIIEDKKLLGDLEYLTSFKHTGSLEVYHSVINKYCPKRLHFSMLGMIARTQLAFLDFNCGSEDNQATNRDGSLRYKQVFSKVTQTWVVKIIKEKKSRKYLDELMDIIINSPEDHNLPILPEDIPNNTAPLEKPDKTKAIKCMVSRFKI